MFFGGKSGMWNPRLVTRRSKLKHGFNLNETVVYNFYDEMEMPGVDSILRMLLFKVMPSVVRLSRLKSGFHLSQRDQNESMIDK